MKFIEKQDFYNSLTEKHSVLDIYQEIQRSNGDTFYSCDEQNITTLDKPISIKLFPSFFKPKFKNEEMLLIQTVPQKKINGYAISTNEKTDITTFLKNEYSKSFRSNIKRFVNRLENCFDIEYKFFHGEMSEKDYQHYMGVLKKMLIARFDQRNEKNDILENWDFYLNSTHQLVIAKQASIFVIYDNETPIHVCVNHHFNDILFVSIPSYDLNYAKFALGNISIYKLLEWAITNNYKMLDMAYGDLEYKRRWSTEIYSFEHHIISPKKNRISNIFAKLEVNTIQFKNLLKKYNIDETIKKLKSSKAKPNHNNLPSFNIDNDIEINTDELLKITALNDENEIVKKLVCEFLFKHKAHINDISVFKKAAENEYFIIGKSSNQKITFK